MKRPRWRKIQKLNKQAAYRELKKQLEGLPIEEYSWRISYGDKAGSYGVHVFKKQNG